MSNCIRKIDYQINEINNNGVDSEFRRPANSGFFRIIDSESRRSVYGLLGSI